MRGKRIDRGNSLVRESRNRKIRVDIDIDIDRYR